MAYFIGGPLDKLQIHFEMEPEIYTVPLRETTSVDPVPEAPAFTTPVKIAKYRKNEVYYGGTNKNKPNTIYAYMDPETGQALDIIKKLVENYQTPSYKTELTRWLSRFIDLSNFFMRRHSGLMDSRFFQLLQIAQERLKELQR